MSPTVSRQIKIDHADTSGTRLLVFEPGNGTRYSLVIAPLSNFMCGAVGAQPGSFLVSLIGQASAPFTTSGYLAASYVQEKLKLNEADAKPVTDMLGYALNRPTHEMRGN